MNTAENRNTQYRRVKPHVHNSTGGSVMCITGAVLLFGCAAVIVVDDFSTEKRVAFVRVRRCPHLFIFLEDTVLPLVRISPRSTCLHTHVKTDSNATIAFRPRIQDVSVVVLQTFRDDGEGYMYQFEIRNLGPEMTESKVISKNRCVDMELQFGTTCPSSLNFWNSRGKMIWADVSYLARYNLTDRLDNATCTHTLLSTDMHISTDHVRYTLRYLIGYVLYTFSRAINVAQSADSLGC
ncbi:hypothetical protein ANN_13704 [Periplaneta americana]|uniref:Uncharacterized protein n=1 Tax=Periplaneta americana TaxID=6978 RepID=A0ABQ8SVH1_PERAM|nr:hypothetical protein ANN_13704 [Periplaneta americana]